jgi:SAM-dependent methyltransferase
MENDNLFDPHWRDDVYDEEALNIPLLLPPISNPDNNKRVWVVKQVIRGEDVFGKYLEHKKPRVITAVIKKVRPHPSRKITDKDGNEVSDDDPLWNFLNPPKAWMSDKADELMSMYSVAKEARGDVLVGGLGMGIFPQMALYLKRPVHSFTIVDNNPEVIKITTNAWLNRLDDRTRDRIKIIELSFADYIKTADNKFDTIFVDLWEDSDSRNLPYINRLVELIKPLCKKGGRIYIWTYALTVDSFVKLVHFFETSDIDIRKIPVPIDPLLTQYGQWRAPEENGSLPIVEYEKKARELALTVKSPDLDYDRDHYFTPYGCTYAERHIIKQILSLASREK